MPKRPQRYYLDSCVLLDLVGEVEALAHNVAHLLTLAEDDVIQLVTSSLSIAEVAAGADEKAQHVLAPETLAAIDALWVVGGPLHIVDYTRHVAIDARNLVRSLIPEGKTGLKGADAVHLASARDAEVDRFYTRDAKLAKYGNAADQAFTISAVPPAPSEQGTLVYGDPEF